MTFEEKIEAVTDKSLAVVRRGYDLPMYFYDYEKPWESITFEDADRNEFGLINPDTNKPSDCLPKQIYTEDMTLKTEISGNIIRITANCETPKEKMVSGIFDIPFEKDFQISCNKADVKTKKVTDTWTDNTHLFVDLGALPSGKTEIELMISGTPREIKNAESVNGLFAAMWFGNHAYMRCTDKETAIKVSITAPDSAYILLINGETIHSKNGELNFNINEKWLNEAPQLFGYSKADFEEALKSAKIERIGATTCSRWSGQ